MANKKRHIHLLEKLQHSKTLTRAEVAELGKFEAKKPKKAPPAAAAQRDWVVTEHAELAKLFEVDIRTIQRWAGSGLPKTPAGYDLAECIAWRIAQVRKEFKDPEASKWDSKYRETKARLAQVNLDQQMGRLISLEEVERGRVERIESIKKTLLAFSQNTAPQLVGLDIATIKDVLDRRIKEIITSFAQGKDVSFDPPAKIPAPASA